MTVQATPAGGPPEPIRPVTPPATSQPAAAMAQLAAQNEALDASRTELGQDSQEALAAFMHTQQPRARARLDFVGPQPGAMQMIYGAPLRPPVDTTDPNQPSPFAPIYGAPFRPFDPGGMMPVEPRQVYGAPIRPGNQFPFDPSVPDDPQWPRGWEPVEPRQVYGAPIRPPIDGPDDTLKPQPPQPIYGGPLRPRRPRLGETPPQQVYGAPLRPDGADSTRLA